MGISGSAYWSIFSSFDGTFQFWRLVNGEFQTANINGQGFGTFYGGTNAASDARLKEEVEDLPSAGCIDLLKAVSAKTYWRNDMGPERRCGFIAQEVEAAAAPALGANLVGETTRSSGLGEGATAESIKTLSYERMAVVLWQCTRTLLARVEALEAKLAP